MAGGGWTAPALATGPSVASMNVCTDQLLIALADPGQIVGLSRFSREEWEASAANDARRYPMLSGGAEDLLVLKPDIIVASLFDKRSTRELLREKGLHLAEFAVPRTLDEVKAQIREMGDIVGHPDRAARKSPGSMRRWRARVRPWRTGITGCCRCRGAAGSPAATALSARCCRKPGCSTRPASSGLRPAASPRSRPS